ncbi:SubName: Full=Related to secretory pathway protein (Exocyst complex protein Sec15) {ECO:0000313/EMBL:CCA69070.1} [Serendipita indica DSM 11827]|nr:SubName: Full=Related to secretory pathway protein (Exocyst complex protein Sec15) {ECO:0000313/EMBL:CCA69070.1} [Serendipita indica DSM 11827]
MAGRSKKGKFLESDIDQQLQQIHLLDAQSTSENLEQLAPIIKNIHATRQQDAYLRTLKQLAESKEAEIQQICSDNYQDFVSSVSTMLNVRSSTNNLRDRIISLDDSVNQAGRALAEKKKGLLKAKKAAMNLDEAIETLQACLRLLDLVNRIGELIKQGKYYSALRSLDDIQNLPTSSLSQTPFFNHLLASLPSYRTQIKDAVTASLKTWLFDLRNVSRQVGSLALEAMDLRSKRWAQRKEKEPQLKLCRLGGAVELITYEKVEYDVFDNDKLQVDFKPLYQSILIYTALEMLEELQKSYQADRKTQSTLILSSQMSLQSLADLTEEITGFFIAETHVLQNTRGFRSQREVDELWEGVLERLNSSVASELETESDPEVFLGVKESLLAFTMTMEGYGYDCQRLHDLILLLFGSYASLLEKQYETIVQEDDNTPLTAETGEELDAIVSGCWLPSSVAASLYRRVNKHTEPGSNSHKIRSFVQKFYQFVEGVSQHHRDIDELLGTSLDRLMTKNICQKISSKVKESQGFSQIAQSVITLEYFENACGEIEQGLASLRSIQRGGSIRLGCRPVFAETLQLALKRIDEVLLVKLESNFEMSDFEWTPSGSSGGPSLYMIQMIMWLTTNIDALSLQDIYKNNAYTTAIQYIADSLTECLTGTTVSQLNDAALSNMLVDIDFVEQSLRDSGQSHLSSIFDHLKLLVSIPLNNTVQEYLNASQRQASYASIRPTELAPVLEKLARGSSNSRERAERERGERRRTEALAVSRL